MANFKCTTEGCSMHNKNKIIHNIQYILDEKKGVLVAKNILCEDCGKDMKEIKRKYKAENICNYSNPEKRKWNTSSKGTIY